MSVSPSWPEEKSDLWSLFPLMLCRSAALLHLHPALAEIGGKDHVLCLAAATLCCRSISQKGGEKNYFHGLLTLLSLLLQTGVSRGPLGAGLRWFQGIWLGQYPPLCGCCPPVPQRGVYCPVSFVYHPVVFWKVWPKKWPKTWHGVLKPSCCWKASQTNVLVFLLFPGHTFYKWLKGNPFSKLGCSSWDEWKMGREWVGVSGPAQVGLDFCLTARRGKFNLCFQYLEVPISFQVSV